MKRKDVLAFARIAGYHADSAAFVRLLVENRVSRESMNEAWSSGVTAKKKGVSCACHQCKKQGSSDARN
jgi:hypothetical protein